MLVGQVRLRRIEDEFDFKGIVTIYLVLRGTSVYVGNNTLTISILLADTPFF